MLGLTMLTTAAAVGTTTTKAVVAKAVASGISAYCIGHCRRRKR